LAQHIGGNIRAAALGIVRLRIFNNGRIINT